MSRNAPQYFIPRPAATGKRGTGKHAAHFVYITASGERLYWSADFALPAIGDRIVITMNGIGPGIVKGYFREGVFLGVMTLALQPPAWLREQMERDAKTIGTPAWVKQGIGCEFGAEIALPGLSEAEAAEFKKGGGTIDIPAAARLLGTTTSEVNAALRIVRQKPRAAFALPKNTPK